MCSTARRSTPLRNDSSFTLPGHNSDAVNSLANPHEDFMPGYSGTPLAKKLGFKPGTRVALVDVARTMSARSLQLQSRRLRS